MLDAVPFVSLDPGEIAVERKEPPDLFKGYFEPESERGPSNGRRVCAANVERLPGVVISRTCEANKSGKAPRLPQSVHVAPIRPFTAFPPHSKTGRPFHELVLEGFPGDDPTEEPGQCYRFLVLAPCPQHGFPEGGLLCLREMQPVPIRHLLLAKKIARLSRLSVGAMTERLYRYFEQSERDYANDEAPEGEPSPIVAKFIRGNEKRAERAAQKAAAPGTDEE